MKVDIRFRGLQSSEALREHTLLQVQRHLRRFHDELSGVLVRIADVNGPKGGVDKVCQVTVHGRRLGTARLEDSSGDAYSAVDLAIARIARSVARWLERARRVPRGAPSMRRAF
jgi:ribosome-associated translation inhibitor RaiA